MLAVKIKSKYAEKARRSLLCSGRLDRGRKILKYGGFVEIPVLTENVSLRGFEFKLVGQERAEYIKPHVSLDVIKKDLRAEVGKRVDHIKGWEEIGNVIILELPPSLDDKKKIIGERFLEFFPRVKTVVNRHGIIGPFRKPEVEVIAGKDTVAVHKEHGCVFKLDVSKVMFSAGNLEERKRMAFISNKEETVLDMFSGIGQFCIPLAKHSKPKKVYAIEKNPVAFDFLKENIGLNKLTNVKPVLGDCKLESPKNAVDRVIMGYFFNPLTFLQTAVEALQGGGVIHYHDIAAKKEIPAKIKSIKEEIKMHGYDAVLIKKRIVKSYAPSRWHVAFDVKI